VEEPIPVFKGGTNGDLAVYIKDLQEWAKRANSDKNKIKEWAHGIGE
jgi:hypothetical protein